jgi:hypothetical protein
LQPAAILNAGTNNLGTLHFSGALTLNALSTNLFAVTTSGGASNKVAVAGLLTPNGSVISVISGTPLHPGTNTLFTYSGGISGSFNATPVFDVAPVHAGSSIVDNGSGQINLVVPNGSPVAGATFTIAATIGIPVSVAIVGGKYPPSDADGDALTISSPAAANGIVTTDGTNITYTATNGSSDTITYTINDGYGATAIGTINVTISAAGNGNNGSISSSGGNAVLDFASVPNTTNVVELTTNLAYPIIWTPVSTNVAGTNGLWEYVYTNPPSPSFFRSQRQ